MAAAAIGPIIGALIGAGGQVAGGLLGSGTGGQGKNSRYDPSLDYALQVAQWAGLDQLGFGNIGAIPNPYEQLVGRLNSASLAEKTRLKALKAIEAFRNDPELFDDPRGENFTADEILQFVRDGGSIPDGRRLPADFEPGGPFADRNARRINRRDSKLPVKNLGRLEHVLRKQGLSLADLQSVLQEEKAYESQIQQLKDAGLGGIQIDTILNRANAAKAASQLLGDAGRFATGGPASEYQTQVYDSLNRSINDQEEALMLQAQFGGFNPAAGLEGIQRMRADSEMTALQQAINAASALTSSLGLGNAQAQQSAGAGTNATLNALGIASQQALAANQLSQQGAINRSDSLANGVAGGLSGIGQSLTLAGLLSGNNAPASQSSQFAQYGGPGSTANQLSTQNAVFSGWNPNANW